MHEVTRYDISQGWDGEEARMVPYKFGWYVRDTDYDRLEKALKKISELDKTFVCMDGEDLAPKMQRIADIALGYIDADE